MDDWGQFQDIEEDEDTVDRRVLNDRGEKDGSGLEKTVTRNAPVYEEKTQKGAEQSDKSDGESVSLTGSSGIGMAMGSCPNFGSLQAAHRRIFYSGLTFSEAKSELWKLRKKGSLTKRGFRFRKLWVKRYVELSGRMLKYYETDPADSGGNCRPRGVLELTPYTSVESIDREGDVCGFNVKPFGDRVEKEPPKPIRRDSTLSHSRAMSMSMINHNGGSSVHGSAPKFLKWLSGNDLATDDKTWRFIAECRQDRDDWVMLLQRAVGLIRRVEVAPTLCGVGSVHFHYTIGDVIGQGRFGDVHYALAIVTQKEYAIRAVDKEERVRTKSDALLLRSEIKVMRRVTRELNHANICKLFQAYEDSSMVYLVMELLSGGDLYRHVANYVTELNENFVCDVLRQITSALAELHGAGIVLCDLTPENLLFSSPDTHVVKVVEFQHARIMTGFEGAASSSASSVGGLKHDDLTNLKRGSNTSVFVAPEVVTSKAYSPACDIWALGCCIFTLSVGHTPFQTRNIIRQEDFNSKDWSSVSPSLKKIVVAMLSVDPQQRPSAASISVLELDSKKADETHSSSLQVAHERIKLLDKQTRTRRRSTISPNLQRPSLALRPSESSDIFSPPSPSSFRLTPSTRSQQSSSSLVAFPPNTVESAQGTGLPSNWSSPDFEQVDQSTGEGTNVTSPFSAVDDFIGDSDADRRAQVLALDVRVGKLRAKNLVRYWGIEEPSSGEGNSSFEPAGRFLNELEGQMRLVREEEQRKLV